MKQATQIYAIINLTPDSFYEGSRAETLEAVRQAAQRALDEGADVLDLGAYSTRPGFSDVPVEEEYRRLSEGFALLRTEFGSSVKISIDTFRSEIVRRLYDSFGEFIVNDVQGGEKDTDILRTVGELSLPYVMMSNHNSIASITSFFGNQIPLARDSGISEIMLDPGFGFGKSVDENFAVMRDLEQLRGFGLPLFVGISRKSMIWRTLKTTPGEALNGTTALHCAALRRGAAILRVHDVKAARECIIMHESVEGL
ncbi:MAG: dihydropteroate synthase [Rikenellaceae bacterium]